MENNLLDLLVGSYCQESEDCIKWFLFDQETGKHNYVSGTTGISNPSYMTFSEDKRFLYSVSENSGAEARLFSFCIDWDKKKLKEINSMPTNGDDPCHVWVDKENSIAVTANYTGGSISVFNLREDGGLKESSVTAFEGGNPESERQHQSHMHFIYSSFDEKYIYANDLGTDCIYKFEKRNMEGTIKLVPSMPACFTLNKGTGPRHSVFHPNRKILYVIGELSGMIEVFSYEESDGNLLHHQSVRVDPLYAAGSADLHISADGKYLYGSNRLAGDGIATFSVDEKTGLLKEADYRHTGEHPRNFVITPNGKFLLCACRNDNYIQIFKIDSYTGTLIDTGDKIMTNQPVCLKL